MASKVIGQLMYVDYKTCLYLESLNLSYKEMCEMFAVKVSPQYLCKKFRKYGIKHKCKCNRLYEEISSSNKSIGELSIKYKIAKSSVSRIRKKARENDKYTHKEN